MELEEVKAIVDTHWKAQRSRAEIFPLNAEDEKRIHPYAVGQLNRWRAEILQEVPELGKLNVDEIQADICTYLSDDEKVRVRKYRADVVEWIQKCTDIGDSYSPYPYSRWVYHPMSELKSLLKKAYEHKTAKAREERRKKEEEKKWWAAYKALNIPAKDAFKYLKPEDREEFTDSILGAVDAYLDRGEEYLRDKRAYAYSRWCKEIKIRREEDETRTAATVKAQDFTNLLDVELHKLELRLSPRKLSTKDCFDEQIRDPRYTGRTFAELLPADKKQDLNASLKNAVTAKLSQLVSDEFRQFITWKYVYSYLLLPAADYTYKGMSCLSFCFDIFAAIRAEIYVKPAEIQFGGYTFHLQVKEGKGSPVRLEAPEFLGYHYLLVTPSDLGYVFWQTIPLVLVVGLMNGELEPTGTTISQALEARITYRIKGFEDEVTIPASFASYLKEIGSIDRMVGMGILSQKVASIIEKKLVQSRVEQGVPLPSGGQATELEDKVKRRRTKKAKAYQLFGEGKGPTSPKVKALGLHKSTRFKYYRQWETDGRLEP